MSNLYQDLPKVDKLQSLFTDFPSILVIEKINEVLDEYRILIKNQEITSIDQEAIIKSITDKLQQYPYHLKPVINATGTIIHTNLGRSVLSEEVVSHVINTATNYTNLEYNIQNQKRGSRYEHLTDLVCRLTGSEDCIVVNNNASAVLLTLTSLVTNSEVIISRGELVEIGGSFRVPEIMNFSNTQIVEVGTTNKTHTHDYINAINDKTTALLKVHTSNYKIMGFTSSVDINTIVKIAHENNLLAIEDLGSGTLIDLNKYSKLKEPTVQQSIKAGCDIVTFSGDKLLGSTQAGFIVGKKQLLDKIRKNNLLRCVRVDKITISILEASLSLYLDEKTAINSIPTQRMISESIDQVKSRATKLSSLIKIDHEIINSSATVGGGSLPNEYIDSFAIAISASNLQSIIDQLHNAKTPIIGRVYQDQVLIDLKTIFEKDLKYVSEVINCLIL